ncbi:serine hydrolase domain-containing protein [Amycolatopsis sp., V23-08]|uniref:Serine hydrolase domain-containing protein n=1 Tax=Amycolatopsis heterodermiae TaxID=3110235 RepID=A0ABU5R9V6_9PSEU|nr:serine hydrolase domain-containing protein [Amycolatopsis sp., V23-08]MEA5363011.1 serine hydrolase domain-containing protein [Amycolatopsis sp., V23-08]
MTWTRQAAHSLTEALSGSSGTEGVVFAAAALDRAETATAVTPTTTAADRRFEIGSVTKTMTATLLALLAGDGTLRLDDEIGRWLSAGQNGAITLRQLATHTSGLPSTAPNLRIGQGDPRNPWAGYGFDRAEEGLRQARVTPGNPWRYSNLGYQLLGLILHRASGHDYPALVTERLLDPLGMTHSGVGSCGAGTLLPGHADGREVLHWDHPLGAGGVEATIEDLARYARACLFPPKTALGTAITLAQTPVLRVDDGAEQALAWIVRPGGVREHSGGTGGFSACVAVDHGRERAVAILVSSQGSPAYSSHLKQAAQLALAGEDPRQAGTPQPWPSWRDDAHAVARAFLDGQHLQVHARLAPQARAKITPEQLERVWTSKIRPAGPAGEILIAHHEIAASGAVVADVTLPFATSPQRLRMVILPSGELGGLALLPSPA